MATIRRLTHSCVIVTSDDHATLLEPDTFTFTSGAVDLDTIGDVTRVLVTHEHGDHVHPEFVSWLIDRRRDLVIYGNEGVAEVLEPAGIEVVDQVPEGTSAEDVIHERLPNGAAPPNRSWTIDGIFTQPGDSFQPTTTAPIMGMSLVAPWGSATDSVEFVTRVKPQQVIPAHDLYLSEHGREFLPNLITGPLEAAGIEFVPLGWGETLTV